MQESQEDYHEEAIAALIRTNLACHIGKTLSREVVFQLAAQIKESLDYFNGSHIGELKNKF